MVALAAKNIASAIATVISTSRIKGFVKKFFNLSLIILYFESLANLENTPGIVLDKKNRKY